MNTVETEHWSLVWKEKYGACAEGVAFAEKTETADEFWRTCNRADWMLWMISKTVTKKQRKRLVLVACACARLALPYVTAGDLRPLTAIEMAERWARGEDSVTLESVKSAANAAADAANAAAYAAYAASAAASAAAYAAYAASAAAYVAAKAARQRMRRQCAEIVREYFPNAPEAK